MMVLTKLQKRIRNEMMIKQTKKEKLRDEIYKSNLIETATKKEFDEKFDKAYDKIKRLGIK